MQIANQKISILKNAWDKDCSHTATVSKIMSAIKMGRWKESIEKIRSTENKALVTELKKSLPAATFCGTFEQRKDDLLLTYSGVVLLDFDFKSISIKNKLRLSLKRDEFVAGFFESPTGGMKILYAVETPAAMHRDVAYPQIMYHFHKTHGVRADATGKNLSRLCFMSYDPDAEFYADYRPFPVDPDRIDKSAGDQRVFIQPGYEASTNMDYVYIVCKGYAENAGYSYSKGNRNNFIYVLSCCLNRAGVVKHDIERIIFSKHSISKDMSAEALRTIRSAVEGNANEFNTKPIWQKKSQNTLWDLLPTEEN